LLKTAQTKVSYSQKSTLFYPESFNANSSNTPSVTKSCQKLLDTRLILSNSYGDGIIGHFFGWFFRVFWKPSLFGQNWDCDCSCYRLVWLRQRCSRFLRIFAFNPFLCFLGFSCYSSRLFYDRILRVHSGGLEFRADNHSVCSGILTICGTSHSLPPKRRN